MIMKDKKRIWLRQTETLARKTVPDAGDGKNIVASLHIVSSKICCFIAEVKNHLDSKQKENGNED